MFFMYIVHYFNLSKLENCTRCWCAGSVNVGAILLLPMSFSFGDGKCIVMLIISPTSEDWNQVKFCWRTVTLISYKIFYMIFWSVPAKTQFCSNGWRCLGEEGRLFWEFTLEVVKKTVSVSALSILCTFYYGWVLFFQRAWTSLVWLASLGKVLSIDMRYT